MNSISIPEAFNEIMNLVFINELSVNITHSKLDYFTVLLTVFSNGNFSVNEVLQFRRVSQEWNKAVLCFGAKQKKLFIISSCDTNEFKCGGDLHRVNLKLITKNIHTLQLFPKILCKKWKKEMKPYNKAKQTNNSIFHIKNTNVNLFLKKSTINENYKFDGGQFIANIFPCLKHLIIVFDTKKNYLNDAFIWPTFHPKTLLNLFSLTELTLFRAGHREEKKHLWHYINMLPLLSSLHLYECTLNLPKRVHILFYRLKELSMPDLPFDDVVKIAVARAGPKLSTLRIHTLPTVGSLSPYVPLSRLANLRHLVIYQFALTQHFLATLSRLKSLIKLDISSAVEFEDTFNRSDRPDLGSLMNSLSPLSRLEYIALNPVLIENDVYFWVADLPFLPVHHGVKAMHFVNNGFFFQRHVDRVVGLKMVFPNVQFVKVSLSNTNRLHCVERVVEKIFGSKITLIIKEDL